MGKEKIKAIVFLADVDKRSVSRLIKEVKASRGYKILLLISSTHGDFDESVRGFRELRKFAKRLTTYNVGLLDTVSGIIYLSADTRLVAPHSEFLFKEIKHTYEKYGEYPPKDILEYYKLLVEANRNSRKIFSSRTRQSNSKLYNLQHNETTLSALDMVKLNIAHRVESINISSNTKIITIS